MSIPSLLFYSQILVCPFSSFLPGNTNKHDVFARMMDGRYNQLVAHKSLLVWSANEGAIMSSDGAIHFWNVMDLWLVLFYFIFILFYFIFLFFFNFILLFLFYFVLFYFILFYFILFYFVLFYFVLFYFILFYFILFYFILFYFILFAHCNYDLMM